MKLLNEKIGARSRTRKKAVPFLVGVAVFAGLLLLLTPVASGIETENIIIKPSPERTLSIKVWLEKSRYSPGEELEVNFLLAEKAYVYIYHVNPAGEVKLLFPNRYQEDNFLSPGRYSIPAENYHLEVREPYGVEVIQAIATSRPIAQVLGKLEFGDKSFLDLSSEPTLLRREVENYLEDTVDRWGSDWVQFIVYRKTGRVILQSEPSGAEVYVDGIYVGRTPLTKTLQAGEREIEIRLPGYDRWSKDVEVEEDRATFLDARLEMEKERRFPSEQFDKVDTVPFSSAGFNLGWGSFGVELGLFQRFNFFLDFFFPQPVPVKEIGEFTYQMTGPEVGTGLSFLFPVTDGFSILIGGGAAIRVFEAVPSANESSQLDSLGIDIEPDREVSVYPFLMGGVRVERQPVYLFGGWGSRREWTVGLGFLLI